MNNYPFEGKAAIVIGAVAGIGLAIVEFLLMLARIEWCEPEKPWNPGT